MFETEYRSRWPEKMGVDVVESRRMYEEYGPLKIVNETFGFIQHTTPEFCEDYVSTMNGPIYGLLDQIERLYCLGMNYKLDDFQKSILMKFHKSQGHKFDSLQSDWMDIKFLISPNQMKTGFSQDGLLPVFQRRTPWKIEHGYICHRCYKENKTLYGSGLRFACPWPFWIRVCTGGQGFVT